MDNYRKGMADRAKSYVAAHDIDYQKRMRHELRALSQCIKAHELPAIYHYWTNTHLAPRKFQQFGITDPEHFFYRYTKKYHERRPGRHIQLVSIGLGSCDMESRLARKLLDSGVHAFEIECIDVNPRLGKREMAYAKNLDVADYVLTQVGNIADWLPEKPCDIVICNQSLHHVLELEYVLAMIKSVLVEEGLVLVFDVIGKNGHQLWPESLGILEEFWRQLPARYKYNHLLKRLELRYSNHDYASGTLEGVRSQDILPLLVSMFSFELFIPFANVISAFIDRPFGYNFNADSEWDQDFINRVHEKDERGLLSGELKPAQMLAALCKEEVETRLADPRLTPEFCIRHTSYN